MDPIELLTRVRSLLALKQRTDELEKRTAQLVAANDELEAFPTQFRTTSERLCAISMEMPPC